VSVEGLITGFLLQVVYMHLYLFHLHRRQLEDVFPKLGVHLDIQSERALQWSWASVGEHALKRPFDLFNRMEPRFKIGTKLCAFLEKSTDQIS
jgi:hypothetical protein